MKQSVYFELGAVDALHDSKKLKKGLDTLPGVLSVSVGNHGHLAVDFDDTGVTVASLEKTVRALGFSPTSIKQEAHRM